MNLILTRKQIVKYERINISVAFMAFHLFISEFFSAEVTQLLS